MAATLPRSISFWIFYLINILINILVSLNTSRLNSLNPYAKKMVFLFLFSIYYITGKTLFKDIHTLLSTALPVLTMYIIDLLLANVRVIGLTGGIACGKSTLVNYLKQNYKIKIIDCDEISKKQRLPGGPAYNFIAKQFGEAYLDPVTKLIKNDKLGEDVFKDKQKLKKLTVGTVKFIFFEILSQIIKNIATNNKLMLVDAPTLYESKALEYFLHPIVVVWVDEEEQVKRLKKRNGYDREEALRRIKGQMPLELKVNKATIALKNQSEPEAMFSKMDKELKKYLPK